MNDQFTPFHYGLFFTENHIQQARKHAGRTPYQAAWSALRNVPANMTFSPSEILNAALAWRCDADDSRGGWAIDSLMGSLPDLSPDALARNQSLVWFAQCVELLRDHPAAELSAWQAALEAQVDNLQAVMDETSVMVRLWDGLVHLCAGIVLERAVWVEAGASVYRQAIDEDVHPEGYILEAVEVNAVEGLRNQILCAQALVLMAEAGQHAGLNLWAYDNRGVSATTAASYPLYYYFYPEKWQWGEKTWKRGEGLQSEVLEAEPAQEVFKARAGWLEILNHHYGNRPLKAVRLILDELRPVMDANGGGLTSLTHGVPEGRRGLFG